MKFTLPWLKEHLDTDAALAAIAERLTMLGLEVEKITDPAARLAGFVVGYVEKAEQHAEIVAVGGDEKVGKGHPPTLGDLSLFANLLTI